MIVMRLDMFHTRLRSRPHPTVDSDVTRRHGFGRFMIGENSPDTKALFLLAPDFRLLVVGNHSREPLASLSRAERGRRGAGSSRAADHLDDH